MLVQVALWIILTLTIASLPGDDAGEVQTLDEDPQKTCCNGPPPPPCPPYCGG